MKYLYLVTHYYWTLKGENLFDDVHKGIFKYTINDQQI